MEQDVTASRAATVRERSEPAPAAGVTGQPRLRWAGWNRVRLPSGSERSLTVAARLGVLDWLQRRASQASLHPSRLAVLDRCRVSYHCSLDQSFCCDG
jgi:hypothetical protein